MKVTIVDRICRVSCGVIKNLFRFPDPVNEVAARVVAGCVVALGAAYLLTQSTPLLAFITYGFLARVATGPTLSPIGQLATRVIVPRLRFAERPTAGPPKRFAQGVGATLSVAALIFAVTGSTVAPLVLVGAIVVAASLESFGGYCLGCMIFARLMAMGLVPETVCEACNNLQLAPTSSTENTGSPTIAGGASS